MSRRRATDYPIVSISILKNVLIILIKNIFDIHSILRETRNVYSILPSKTSFFLLEKEFKL